MFHATGQVAISGVLHFYLASLWEDLGLTGEVESVGIPAYHKWSYTLEFFCFSGISICGLDISYHSVPFWQK